MKKRIFLLFAFIIFSIYFISAGMGNNEEKILSFGDVATDNIVVRGVGDACRNVIDTEDVKENFYSAVYGEIMDIKYSIDENGHIFTIEELQIENAIAGENLAGKINVVREGGLARIQDFVDSFTDDTLKNEMSNMFSKKIGTDFSDKYISQYDRLDIPVRPGMKMILLLQKSDGKAPYTILGGSYGEYLEFDDNCFFTTSTGLSYDAFLSGEYAENFEDPMMAKETVTISKAELVDKINTILNM